MKLSLPNKMTTENPPATVQVERGRRNDSELPGASAGDGQLLRPRPQPVSSGLGTVTMREGLRELPADVEFEVPVPFACTLDFKSGAAAPCATSTTSGCRSAR